MNRTDRLYALVEELRAVSPRPRSARWLAARFEVSSRTVERDLSALQQGGVPIWAEPGRTGGYCLDAAHTLPPIGFTVDEALAVMVSLGSLATSPFREAALSALGKQLAMHIAAAQPQAISPDELDQTVVARERAIILEQVKESGKSAEIAEKMVDGRMRKYFEEVTLLAQTFVIDGETKVGVAIKNAEKDVGAPIKLTKFVRFALGEGIEKAVTDFAAEVAATSGVKQN